MKFTRNDFAFIVTTITLYTIYFIFNAPVNYSTCLLCDGKQYLKLYWFFEEGIVTQITYPFYTRPLVPLLASLVPGSDPNFAFHIINLFFIIASIITIKYLWNYLSIESHLQWIGFGWLVLHWCGIIRHNLHDFVTVDVPVYFIQALALILFLKKKYKWFYFITPLAIIQKESFLGVVVILLVAHIWESKAHWFKEGQHLLFSALLGISFQFLVMEIMPPQNHKWHPLLTIMLSLKMTLDDPTRLIRWFTAFGSAYGLIPFVAFFQIKRSIKNSSIVWVLIGLSALYLGFGLLADGDMTRILFLGFPFIMTLALLSLQKESRWLLVITIILSVISLRLTSLPFQESWILDYQSFDGIIAWAFYYGIASIALFLFWIKFRASRKV